MKGLILAMSGYLGATGMHYLGVKSRAFEYARQLALADGSGIINLGAGPHKRFAQNIARAPQVVINLDVAQGDLPNPFVWDMETRLPFANKRFSVAFASHVLEHLDNWELALSEASRVSENVVVVLPSPISAMGWLAPQHRQHFGYSSMHWMERNFPNVRVFS